MWFTAEQLWQYTRASAVWRRFWEDNSRIKDHLWIIGNITFQGLYKASNVTLFQGSGKRNNQKILNGTLDFPFWWTTEWKDFLSNDVKFAHQPIQGNVLEKLLKVDLRMSRRVIYVKESIWLLHKRWIELYIGLITSLGNCLGFVSEYPVDCDLFCGQHYQTFEQLWPEK